MQESRCCHHGLIVPELCVFSITWFGAERMRGFPEKSNLVTHVSCWVEEAFDGSFVHFTAGLRYKFAEGTRQILLQEGRRDDYCRMVPVHAVLATTRSFERVSQHWLARNHHTWIVIHVQEIIRFITLRFHAFLLNVSREHEAEKNETTILTRFTSFHW